MASDPSSSSPAFPPLVPGFEFLQSLVKKNTGVGLPGFGQWIAPTLNPEELDKRIEELKAVQFWLEQNARMLGATIQALEVQRMTLSTLKTMNLQMTDLRDALTARVSDAGAPAAAAAPKQPAATPAAEPSQAAKPGPGGAVDAMQWWNALTQQFTQLAATALRDGSAARGPDDAAGGSGTPAAPAGRRGP